MDLAALGYIFKRKIRKKYTIRKRENHFTKWSEKGFLQRFRITQRTSIFILKMIASLLRTKTTAGRVIKKLQ